jgi:mRNA deadenylase 3'-5' endonuclease subunit Ccr4
MIALQEVDAPLHIPAWMEECGYHGHHTPTDVTGKNGRVDACALYFRRDRWTSVQVEMIHLDDLATLCTYHPPQGTVRTTTSSSSSASTSSTTTRSTSLIGIESNFLRKNMALLVRLQHLTTGYEIVVAVTHLFWNPIHKDVKVRRRSFSSTLVWVFCLVCVSGVFGFGCFECGVTCVSSFSHSCLCSCAKLTM